MYIFLDMFKYIYENDYTDINNTIISNVDID